MQEYSVPAVVEIAPSASLADVVFERADREPGAVVMRRQAAGGGPPWREITAAQFRREVTALAKGLIAAGIGARRRGWPCCPGPGTSGRSPTTRSSRPAR